MFEFTHVVDNNRTVHDVHTYTVAFQSLSPDQVQYLSLSSDTDAHSVNGSRKRFTAYDTWSYYFLTIPHENYRRFRSDEKFHHDEISMSFDDIFGSLVLPSEAKIAGPSCQWVHHSSRPHDIVSGERIKMLLSRMGMTKYSGRHHLAPQLQGNSDDDTFLVESCGVQMIDSRTSPASAANDECHLCPRERVGNESP